MSNSFSQSCSDTYSETRAKYVLGKIYDDFYAMYARGFSQFEQNSNQLQNWKEDLFFIMKHKDLDYFQLQFTYGNPQKNVALQYSIKADGSIQLDNDSGKIDYYQFPKNTNINIVVRHYGNNEVLKYLTSKGWGNNGKFVEGNSQNAGAYSKDGYGATRNKIGEWEQ